MPIIRLDGAAVEYRQDGGGPDLLLLHSLLTEMSVFDLVVPPLARRHRVTRLNLPGFGASSPVALNSGAEHADHVARVMDALSLPSTVDVFGNGFGAFVALELAIGHGARIGRLLAADTAPGFPEAGKAPFRAMAERVRAGGVGAILDTAIGRMFPASFQAAHPEIVATRKAALARVDAECFARACLALAMLDLGPRLSGIRNPTLVLCGALDQTTPPALAREVASAISGAVYRDIEGCGHCPMLEQPEALVSMIETFVSESGKRMAEAFRLRVNGRDCEVSADPNTPLLYILRNDLKLKGTRFGCGDGQCGACKVLFDGHPVQSCDTPLWSVPGHEITTIEGIGTESQLHPVQQAFIDEQAIQCGYCVDGIIMAAVALLEREKDPSDEQIVAVLDRNLCRCGTHMRILRAIRSAARAMRQSSKA